MAKSKYAALWKQHKAAQKNIVVETSVAPVLIRPVRLADLAVSGVIPVTLLDEVEALRQTSRARKGKLDFAEVLKALPIVDAVVKAAVVDPVITDDGAGEDEIAIGDIPFEDKFTIFSAVNEPSEALRTFRQGEGEPADAPQPGNGLPHEAVGGPGD